MAGPEAAAALGRWVFCVAQLERRQVSLRCAGATCCWGRVSPVAEGPSLAARPVAQALPPLEIPPQAAA